MLLPGVASADAEAGQAAADAEMRRDGRRCCESLPMQPSAVAGAVGSEAAGQPSKGLLRLLLARRAASEEEELLVAALGVCEAVECLAAAGSAGGRRSRNEWRWRRQASPEWVAAAVSAAACDCDGCGGAVGAAASAGAGREEDLQGVHLVLEEDLAWPTSVGRSFVMIWVSPSCTSALLSK